VGYLNDIWVFDPAKGNWTWWGGDNVTNSLGNKGASGQFSMSYIPPARSAASMFVSFPMETYLFGGIRGGFFDFF
jgi:hypothetical protein